MGRLEGAALLHAVEGEIENHALRFSVRRCAGRTPSLRMPFSAHPMGMR